MQKSEPNAPGTAQNASPEGLRPIPAHSCLRSVTAPPGASLRRWLVAGLIAALPAALWTAGSPAPAAADDGDQPADSVVLIGGERLACEIVEAGARIVQVRIGSSIYALERAQLTEVREAGRPALDPAWLAYVRDVAPRLAAPDARLADAARAGLEALGQAALPYLEAAAADAAQPPVRRALDALIAALRKDAGKDR